jgi:type VI secretion system protein ImpC
MLRMPYGERTDPIDSFDFEEFTVQEGLRGMLWGNSAVVAGLLLGLTFSQQGAKMKPGSVLGLGDMPFYYYTDADGDQTALPCTERMLSSKAAELVSKHRFMPVLSIKNRPEVRLAGFTSLADTQLAGPWQAATALGSAPGVEEKVDEAEASAAEEPVAADEPESTTQEASTAESQDAAPDPELEKLLAEAAEQTAPPAEPESPTPGDTSGENAAEPEMDPELAKLLKELD